MMGDDFPDDWYGWLTNQCGHMVLGLASSVVMLWAGGWTPLSAGVVYWLVVELVLQRGKLLADSLMDTFFVMAGASVLIAYDMGPLVLVGVALIVAGMLGGGIWKRL